MDEQCDAVMRADFLYWPRTYVPLPPAVVNGIIRLHDEGWTAAEIARALNRWRKPRLNDESSWSAIEVRMVLVLTADPRLRPALSD